MLAAPADSNWFTPQIWRAKFSPIGRPNNTALPHVLFMLGFEEKQGDKVQATESSVLCHGQRNIG